MSKAVLISIKPEWCKKIANGEKTIEVRKTRPKLKPPFKCYIYCSMKNTKEPWQYLELHTNAEIYKMNGKVIGEFICDYIEDYIAEFTEHGCYEDIRKKSYNEFIEEDEEFFVTSNERKNPDDCYLCEKSCLSFEKIKKYIFKNKSGFYDFYGWHISNLKIYDKPKDLCEFTGLKQTRFGGIPYHIKRPPQSWCYVRELEG